MIEKVTSVWDLFPKPVSAHYFQRYVRFVEARRAKPPVVSYVEKHHIFPVWYRRIDRNMNFVSLTAREHVYAHRLLWRAFRSKQSYRAYYMMLHAKKGTDSREFAILREKKAQYFSGQNNPMFGAKRHDLAERNSRNPRRGEDHPFFGKHLSEQSKRKISDANRGKRLGTKCPEHSERMKGSNNPLFGKKSERMSALMTKLNAVVSTCDRCGKTGKGTAMKRWHFENCKYGQR